MQTIQDYMATLSDEARSAAEEWLNSRPPAIRKLVEQRPPHLEYRWKYEDGTISESTYRVVSYLEPEDGSEPTMVVETEGMLGLFPRQVFGVNWETLVPVEESTDKMSMRGKDV